MLILHQTSELSGLPHRNFARDGRQTAHLACSNPNPGFGLLQGHAGGAVDITGDTNINGASTTGRYYGSATMYCNLFETQFPPELIGDHWMHCSVSFIASGRGVEEEVPSLEAWVVTCETTLMTTHPCILIPSTLLSS
eukprot:COSAG02_NODE_7224_length_3110_cov_5.939223_3_plen_138_part_00